MHRPRERTVVATGVVGVVLAAGIGSRMRPLTDRTPKSLLTVAGRPLLDLALERVRQVPGIAPSARAGAVAVNVHHLADQVETAARTFQPGVHVSDERAALLGTAGAVHRLAGWIDDRAVVVANSDVWLTEPPRLLEGWDGVRPRLLVQDAGRPADFGTLRFLGMSVLPAHMAAALTGQPSGLYGAVWQRAAERGDLDFVVTGAPAFDCGTPAEFITANLHAARARSVLAPDAVIDGEVDLSVVLAGGRVAAGEHLIGAVRDRFGATVLAAPADIVPPAGLPAIEP